MCKVIKRDGTQENFDFSKIKNAVNKAFKATYNQDAPDDFIDYLNAVCLTLELETSVEEIQDIVENALMEHK